MDAVLKKIEEMKEEQKELFAKSQAEMTAKIQTLVDSDVDFANRIKAMEDLAAPRRKYFSLPGVNEEGKEFSFLRAINGIATKDWSNAGFEKEVFDNMSKKTVMGTTLDPTGGFIVPTEYTAQLIEMFMANLVLNKLGASVMTGLTAGSIKMPKQLTGSTAYWVAENSAITESNQTFGQIEMTPKKIAALVKLSNELLARSNPGAEAIIRRDIVNSLTLATDIAGLRGTGLSGQPRGILNTPDINTVAIGTAGGTLTFDHLLNMQYELQVDNAYQGNLGYVFHPAIRRKLLQSKVAQYSGDTAGEYIIQPMVSDAQLQSWIGHPYQMTTQIPINLTKSTGSDLTEVYFGNWQEMLIGQWAGMSIMASQETSDAFEKMQTWVRIAQEVDIQVRHPESFCVITDAAAK